MAWASQAGVSLNAVFIAAGKARSKKPYWAKERFYGGVIPTDDDIAWARIHAINSVLSTEDLGALYQHRKSGAYTDGKHFVRASYIRDYAKKKLGMSQQRGSRRYR